MRVITWNMGCGYGQQFRRTHDEAWRYLTEELRPDIALVQEALLQESLGQTRRERLLVHGAWKRTCDWGSGVHSSVAAVEEVDSVECEGVHAASARVETATGPVTLTSVHVGTTGDQDARLASLADALAARGGIERMIVAGDFNAARHYDEVYPDQGDYAAFFEKMSTLGFFECHWRLHGREAQSFWRKGTVEPTGGRS